MLRRIKRTRWRVGDVEIKRKNRLKLEEVSSNDGGVVITRGKIARSGRIRWRAVGVEI